MSRARAAARVLDQAGGARAMTGVIGVMLFLTVLAAALGLGTRGAARTLDRALAGRLTVQVTAGDAIERQATAERIAAALRGVRNVSRATSVPRSDLVRLLQPWMGANADDGALPLPALVDVDLRGATGPVVAAVRAVAPDARVDGHARWMTPVSRFMALLTGLAAALVALLAAATAAVVALAVRNGLEAHRGTVEVMHMLGSTDVQVARLFQRRIARDAALGGGLGGLAALGVVALVGREVAGLGSELLGGAALSPADWAALALLPALFVALAVLAARRAVLADLRRTL